MNWLTLPHGSTVMREQFYSGLATLKMLAWCSALG